MAASYKTARQILNDKPENQEPTKQRTTLYVDKQVYEKFQKLCHSRNKSISEVIEAAMRDILAVEK
jgi:hypothetical protein